MESQPSNHLSLERQFVLQTIYADVEKADNVTELKQITKELALQLLLTQQFISDSTSTFGSL